MRELKVGDRAPGFELEDQDGKTVSLADFSGKKVLMYFYPRADTPGCTIQSCSVRDAMPDLSQAGIAAIGISPDKPAAQKAFEAKFELNFPLLCDTDHAVAEAYGVWGEKSMHGKHYMGIIRSSFLIDESGVIQAAWYKVGPKDTVANAMAAIA